MGDGQQIRYVRAQKKSHQPMAQEDAGRSHQSKTEPLGQLHPNILVWSDVDRFAKCSCTKRQMYVDVCSMTLCKYNQMY